MWDRDGAIGKGGAYECLDRVHKDDYAFRLMLSPHPRYRVTQLGLELGVLLVKLRTRLLGPLTTDLSTRRRPLHHNNSVHAAFRQVDAALDHLSATLGLNQVA